MVHRDIKPANLLIPHPEERAAARRAGQDSRFRPGPTARQDARAIPSRLRGETGVLGTPDYISPEQSRDIHAADIRSDLYSLGCAFYFTLAGRVPFPGENAMEKLIKHLMEQPEPLEKVRPDVPPAVAAIVRRLMAKEPDDRFSTPAELAQELEKVSGTLSEKVANIPFKATPTVNQPIWITPPTCLPSERPVTNVEPNFTRILDNVEAFAPSKRAEERSGPSLLEPLWKYAPDDPRRTPRRTIRSRCRTQRRRRKSRRKRCWKQCAHPPFRISIATPRNRNYPMGPVGLVGLVGPASHRSSCRRSIPWCRVCGNAGWIFW